MTQDIFVANDGKKININVWEEVENAKGVVQIFHGMAEHGKRYDDFASYLNSHGYIVLADDHRAHGETDKDKLGIRENGDLFEDTVRDEIELTKYIKEKYNLPVFVFGHSYGSFLLQRYLITESNNISGAIICGSALMKGFLIDFGYMLAKNKCKKDKDGKGETFAKLTFVSYDKKLKEGHNAWLSFNKENVEKYNSDELCGFTCSNGFYNDFFKGLKGIAKKKWYVENKNLPILIISGSNDPVGSNGKLVKKLYKKYKSNKCKVEMMLVTNGRHEILNEYNKNNTYSYIYNYLTNC